MAIERVKFLRGNTLGITFLTDWDHFEVVHIKNTSAGVLKQYKFIRNAVHQKNQIKIQDRD